MAFATRLFVGNLPSCVQDADLHTAFSSYGEVTNVDIKSKSADETDSKKFAFVTISASNSDVESSIKFFSSTDFKGNRLYVTRARESFLERLQRERQEVENKEAKKNNPQELAKTNPVLKLSDKLNPRKRKNDTTSNSTSVIHQNKDFNVKRKPDTHKITDIHQGDWIKKKEQVPPTDKKKHEADKKRLESLQKKRQEFKDKQMIIKTGLIGIDKVPNKKVIFSDNEEEPNHTNTNQTDTKLPKNKKTKRVTLFEGDESDDEVNFEIKKQYEGKKGQKVLDLQSRYKSDKRFVLDERFVEEDQSEDDNDKGEGEDFVEKTEMTQDEEKSKQIKILEDVLGVAIKSHVNKPENDKKNKPTMGMIRFDPMNPEHAKFVVPIEEVKQETKKSKKAKLKDVSEPVKPVVEAPKVEVSMEQFYKSEISKEAFEKPAAESFSLRSLFGRNEHEDETKNNEDQEASYIPLQSQKAVKVKNPLDPGEKNPFMYDSSESEGEEDDEGKKEDNVSKNNTEIPEVKAVWKENLFFCKDDIRLRDGLAFFSNNSNEPQKERRELKSVMKKRIYNTERKNQMFKKKIGGRKKSMKKSYRKKS